MNFHAPTLQRSLSDVVAEYDHKHAAIAAELVAFNAAGDALKMASTIGGTWRRAVKEVAGVTNEHLRGCIRIEGDIAWTASNRYEVVK